MTQNKRYRLSELARLLDLKLIGDESCEITGLGTLANASSGELSFLSNPSYIDQLDDCRASAVILSEKFVSRWTGNALVAEAPYVAFAHATALFSDMGKAQTEVHPSAVIADDVEVPTSVSIGATRLTHCLPHFMSVASCIADSDGKWVQ